MSQHVNKATGVVFSVSDDKDYRYTGELYGSPDAESEDKPKRGPGRPRKTD